MIPLKQRFIHDPRQGVFGDCMRACVASILELGLDEVPHFNEDGPSDEVFCERVKTFLATRGLIEINIAIPGAESMDYALEVFKSAAPAGTHYIFNGTSRTGVNHAVVACGNRIVHDPSLTDAWIIGPLDSSQWIGTFLGSSIAIGRKPLTAQEIQAKRAIAAYIAKFGVSPSLHDIAAAIGLKSIGNVHSLVKRMVEKGHLRKTPKKYRCIEVI